MRLEESRQSPHEERANKALLILRIVANTGFPNGVCVRGPYRIFRRYTTLYVLSVSGSRALVQCHTRLGNECDWAHKQLFSYGK